MLTPDEDEKVPTPDEEFIVKLKTVMDKPKKIKEYIDHKMKDGRSLGGTGSLTKVTLPKDLK